MQQKSAHVLWDSEKTRNDFVVITVSPEKRPAMTREAQTWSDRSNESVQLREFLSAMYDGKESNVASFDATKVGQKVGEVIARSASSRPNHGLNSSLK
jgi:hypothetical protein